MGLGEHILGSNDAHSTPESVLAPLVRTWGAVDFDPCGHPGNIFARQTVLLREVHHDATKTAPAWTESYERAPKLVPLWAGALERQLLWGDGLALDWSGRGLVYFNPPFSDIASWLVAARDADDCVGLLPARMNAAYMHELGFPHARAACYPRRRITFLGSTTQPPWHCVLLFFGERVDLFARAYSSFGLVVPFDRDAADVIWAGAPRVLVRGEVG